MARKLVKRIGEEEEQEEQEEEPEEEERRRMEGANGSDKIRQPSPGRWGISRNILDQSAAVSPVFI